MKSGLVGLLTFIFFCLASNSSQAQVQLMNGELYVNAALGMKGIQKIFPSEDVKVALKSESQGGEIAILSDLIIHQDLKMYVVNPINGKVSRVDLDKKSDYYGSVEVVSGLVVKYENQFYTVNPANGKTKRM